MPVSVRGMTTFDRKIWKTKWARIQESPVKKAGLYVRKIAVNSIRHRRGTSRPGSPPRSHDNRRMMQRIFSVPNATATVTHVGPYAMGHDAIPVPALHEFGLAVTRTLWEPRAGQPNRNSKGKFVRVPRVQVTRMVNYPERSFMRRAKRIAMPKLPEMWRNSIAVET